MRPLARPLDVSMLDGIDVHVIDVVLQIDLVTNPMLPKPPLSYAALAPRCARSRDGFAPCNGARKATFDQRPTSGKIVVVPGQRPDRVHVFGKHHPSDHFEEMALFGGSHRSAQIIDVFDQKAR